MIGLVLVGHRADHTVKAGARVGRCRCSAPSAPRPTADGGTEPDLLHVFHDASEAFEADDPKRNRIELEVGPRAPGVYLEIRDDGPGLPIELVDELLPRSRVGATGQVRAWACTWSRA